MKKKDKIGQVVLHAVFIGLMVAYLVPIVTLVSSSFSTETALFQNGYMLIPKEFSLEAYRLAFRNSEQMLRSYAVTIFFTGVSTALSTVVMALLAYPLSRSNFLWKKQLNFFVYFTMLFSGGMVPSYMLITSVLHMNDNIWVYIIPHLVSAYNVMIIRTSYRAVPDELVEAAKMDGAKELFICFKIIVPLSKASIASVAFLYLVQRWNDWLTSSLYIRDYKLYSLQYLLQRLLREVDFLKSATDIVITDEALPSQTLRLAMAVLAAGPVLFIFPFFQKYFTKGMTIGGVKG